MYVFGNGESRTSVNIDNLNGTKIGCNAIYRDYTMDHLVCVDRRMVNEVIGDLQKNNYALVYTREDWLSQYKQFKRVQVVPNPKSTRPGFELVWISMDPYGPYGHGLMWLHMCQ